MPSFYVHESNKKLNLNAESYIYRDYNLKSGAIGYALVSTVIVINISFDLRGLEVRTKIEDHN